MQCDCVAETGKDTEVEDTRQMSEHKSASCLANQDENPSDEEEAAPANKHSPFPQKVVADDGTARWIRENWELPALCLVGE